jgi:hypothetical protein
MIDRNAPITRSQPQGHNAPVTQSTRPRIFFPGKDVVSLSPLAEQFKKYPVITVFGEEFDMDLYATLDEPSRVREFTSDFWELSSRQYKELKKETTERDRLHVRALRLLRRAYIGEDEDSAREIMKKVEDLCIFPPEHNSALALDPSWGGNLARARHLYPLVFSRALKQARVRMWPTESGEFLPVIWCPDMTTAMFAYAAFEGVETCLNCAKLFCTDLPRVDDSHSEKYCTVACGQRFRQRIYRQRDKKKTQKVSKGKS